MRQWLILARLDALQLAALLLRKVVMMIRQFLRMDSFNKSRLHAIPGRIIPIDGTLPVFVMC